MRAESRDRDIIAHILRYCEEIGVAHEDFGCSKEKFISSTTYQNAVCMCILQIGELVNRLTEEFKNRHPEIPWHKIRGMRNFVAHEYGSLDLEVVWYVAVNSVNDVQSFCRQYLTDSQQ